VAEGGGHRVAVIPLDNISPDPSDAYFADGMTEELIATLSRIAGLRVIARTSAMRFKGAGKTVAEIGRELRVRTVLEGSVRKSADKLRITVQLIDAVSEENLWSQVYDRALEDVFSIQRDIAQRIAKALKVRIAARDQEQLERPATGIVDAYTLYLQGRQRWNLRSEDALHASIQLFERALEKDPRFSLAQSGLSDAYAALALLEFSPPTDAFPKARAAAEKALALDDRSAEAYASLGLVRFQYDRDFAAAERDLRRAVALNPNYPAGHQYLADYLKALGRFDEATAEMRAALELDPLSMAINTGLGHVLYLSREYDRAIEQYRKALELDPKFVLAHLWFGRPYLQKGRFDEAIAEIQQAVTLSGGSTMSLAVLAHALASAGREAEARKILSELLERSKTRYLPSYWIALVYTGFGEDAVALQWLERAYEERSSWLVWIGVEPRFDRLRGTPGFRSLLGRMRLPPGEPAGPTADGTRDRGAMAGLLERLEEIDLDRYRVVGSYTRYDAPVRHALKDLRQKIAAAFDSGAPARDNFLLWGAPGTGKTFFVRESFASLSDGVRLVELNLAELDELGFRAGLADVRNAAGPVLCFVDEVDSKPHESWPYEAMLPGLDLGGSSRWPRVFVLAGSSGASTDAMKSKIAARAKGADLLSRIPNGNEFAIPELSPEDRLIVGIGALRQATRNAGKNVGEIEKLALFYLAVRPELANPRQLRDRITRAVDRLPSSEARFKFDFLFDPGDLGNKEFWVSARSEAPSLINAYIRIGD
jgi:TolB-like protein/Tfp pilus assembly protein PilF